MKKIIVLLFMLVSALFIVIGCVNPSKDAFLTVEQRACIGTGCGRCFRVCNYDAIVFIGNKAVIDPSKCNLCGKCVKVCPYSAIY